MRVDQIGSNTLQRLQVGVDLLPRCRCETKQEQRLDANDQDTGLLRAGALSDPEDPAVILRAGYIPLHAACKPPEIRHAELAPIIWR